MKALIGDVPSDWTEMTLADVCTMQTGVPRPRLSAAGPADDGVPVLTLKDVRERRITPDGSDRVTDAPDLARYRLATGDVVSSRFFRNHQLAAVTEQHRGWLHNDTLFRFRPADSLSPDFLVAYLTLAPVLDWIERRTTATAMATLSLRLLATLPVVVPPMEVQTAIVATLGALDEKIHIHAQISRTTAELRDALAPMLLTGAVTAARA